MGRTISKSSRGKEQTPRDVVAHIPIQQEVSSLPSASIIQSSTAKTEDDDTLIAKAYRRLMRKVAKGNTSVNIERVRKAFQIAKDAHKDQRRSSGDPFLIHPIAVAEILADMKLDTETLVTALLHDTVEDTSITIHDIEKIFGKHTARLVSGVTKLAKLEYQPEHIKQAENFRKLLLAVSKDIRVLLVKLADRVHNMRTLSHMKDGAKRSKKARETMDIYAPLAERIGIHKFKNELQDLAFAELYPEIRDAIMNRISFLRQNTGVMVKRIEHGLRHTLVAAEIKAEVYGREKSAFSIWKKMETKNVTFEQVSDVIAFRVLVDDVQSCYQALGAIHSHYHTISAEFKDYISTPKNNGYQSLHTLIIGPGNRPIEVQIRTHHMHEVAELGVAAHWAYKQAKDEPVEGRQYRWLRELLDILEHTSNPEEFMENTRLEMFYDQVFCFSPKGDLIALPRGSTPVDFAFAVHSKVGLSCIGARVNGRIVPLNNQLENGDQVEILRGQGPAPSPAWEGFVTTGKARAEIRRFLKARQQEEHLNLGHAVIQKAFHEVGQKVSQAALETLTQKFKRRTVEELTAAVGQGVIKGDDVMRVLISPPNEIEGDLNTNVPLKRKKSDDANEVTPILIDGMEYGQSVNFARCCHPIPGDRIIGINKPGQGLTIHVVGCNNLEKYANCPDNWMDVSWGSMSKSNNAEPQHAVKITVVISHEIGSLATIATAIAKLRANVTDLVVTGNREDFCCINIYLLVLGVHQLNTIIGTLKTLDCVYSVERVKYSPEYQDE